MNPQEYVAWLSYSAGYLVVGVAMLFLAKKVFDLLTPFSLDRQLTEKDNPAVGIIITGYLVAIGAVICSLFVGESLETPPTLELFKEEMVDVLIYGALGIGLVFLSGIINDYVILSSFSNRKEIIERQNKAVATIQAATYIGSGLIIAGAIIASTDIVSALAMYALGQLVLVVFAKIYELITKYDDQQEVGENQNLAAGLGFGGNLLALSIVLMRGATIPLHEATEWTWADRLERFGYFAIGGAVLLIVARFVSDHLFLPKAKISQEILKDRNINAGLIETGIAITTGAMLAFCL